VETNSGLRYCSRKKGRTLVLATASDQRVVRQVAEHLNLFDLVLSSDGVRNLKGSDKLVELKERYGTNFDYVASSSADLPIWKECRQAITVDAPSSVIERAEKASSVGRVFDSRRPIVPLIVSEMRLHQWLKNLLVFVPLLTSHQFARIDLLVKGVIAFIAFGLVASNVYIPNDIFDLQSDRNHHRKRWRPFASGDLPLPWAFLLGPGLLVAGFGLVGFLVPSALGVLLTYYLLSLYSYWLKGKLLLDVFAPAALYTIRIVMGGAAYHVDLSV
jgi:hypothetical protein